MCGLHEGISHTAKVRLFDFLLKSGEKPHRQIEFVKIQNV